MQGDVNKLFVFKSLLTTPSNVLPLHLKQTFPPIIWIFTEGDGIKSRLPFKIFSTLPWIKLRGLCKACLTAWTWDLLSSGKFGAENCLGTWVRNKTSSTVWPEIIRWTSFRTQHFFLLFIHNSKWIVLYNLETTKPKDFSTDPSKNLTAAVRACTFVYAWLFVLLSVPTLIKCFSVACLHQRFLVYIVWFSCWLRVPLRWELIK